MCDPVTLAISATALAAAGTVAKTVSSVQQANADRKVANNNAAVASAQAADAQERGKLDLQRIMRRNSQQAGQQRLALAANGVETDFGSAADVQRDAAMIASEDYGAQLKNTERETAGYDISAANYRTKASMAKSAKTAAIVGGVVDFGTTILSGAQQVGKIKTAQAGGAS